MCLQREDDSLGCGVVTSALDLLHDIDHAFVDRTIGFGGELFGVDQAEPHNRIRRTVGSG